MCAVGKSPTHSVPLFTPPCAHDLGFRKTTPLHPQTGFLQAIESLPRFGFQDDFIDLLGEKRNQQSYLVGLVCAGILLQSIKFAWGMLLVLFMCCGEKRLGFLTGQPFRQPLRVATTTTTTNRFPPDVFHNEEQPYNQERRRYYYRDAGCSSRPTKIRATFLACGVVFVFGSILGVTRGLAQLQSTVVLFEDTIGRVAELSGEATDVLEHQFLSGGRNAQQLLDELSQQLRNDTFCPSGPLPPDGVAYYDNAMLALQQAGFMAGFLNATMALLYVPLKQVALGSDQIDKMVAALPVDVTDWKVTLMLIPFGVTTVALMGGTVIAMLDVSLPCYTSLTQNLLLPVFSMLVQFVWVTASGMMISAGINGDICLPRNHNHYDDGGNPPDASVRNIMTALGLSNTTAYPIIDYYVSQCQTDDPLFFLDVAHAQLEESEFSLHRLGLDFSSLSTNMTQVCGRDYTDLLELLTNADNLVFSMVDSFSKIRSLIACPTVVPIYADAVYKGVCTAVPDALFWIWGTCLIMGIAGMLMITFRSACKLTVYYVEGEEDHVNANNHLHPHPYVDKPEEEVRTRDTVEEDEDEYYESEYYGGTPPPQRWIGWEEIEEDEDDDDDEDNDKSTASPSVISDPVYLYDHDDRAVRRPERTSSLRSFRRSEPPPPPPQVLARGSSGNVGRWPTTAPSFRRSAPQLHNGNRRGQLYHRDYSYE